MSHRELEMCSFARVMATSETRRTADISTCAGTPINGALYVLLALTTTATSGRVISFLTVDSSNRNLKNHRFSAKTDRFVF
jgi:hypothetical protein